MKYSSDLLVRWKRKFCVLKNKKLVYYPDSEMTKMEGIIDFDLVSVVIKIETA
jgi:hypothetical protein